MQKKYDIPYLLLTSLPTAYLRKRGVTKGAEGNRPKEAVATGGPTLGNTFGGLATFTFTLPLTLHFSFAKGVASGDKKAVIVIPWLSSGLIFTFWFVRLVTKD